MAYGRAISKAVKQAGKQQQANTRGLSGNRNSQGDFMTEVPEAVRMEGFDDIGDAQRGAEPDIQNYINDVKAQIDEIDAQIAELEASADIYKGNPMSDDNPNSIIIELKSEKLSLLEETIAKLKEEGIEVPDDLLQEHGAIYRERAKALSMNNATGGYRTASDFEPEDMVDFIRE